MEGVKLGTPALTKEKASSTPWEVDLEKQMLAWSENPSWVDQPPEIKVIDNKLSRKKMFCTNSVFLGIVTIPIKKSSCDDTQVEI